MQPRTVEKAGRVRRLCLAVSCLSVFSVAACAQPADTMSVTVIVTAGPVCPVVTDPLDPACADRPVDGAELVGGCG